jgi:hypothetical protein
LPPDRYPCLVEAAVPMSSGDQELHYRFGVDVFIAGVRAMAPGAQPGSGGERAHADS